MNEKLSEICFKREMLVGLGVSDVPDEVTPNKLDVSLIHSINVYICVLKNTTLCKAQSALTILLQSVSAHMK